MKAPRTTISLSKKVLAEFDAWWKDRYDNRSQALRAAMKRLMNEESEKK